MIRKILIGIVVVSLVIGCLIIANNYLDKSCLALSAFEALSIINFFKALVVLGLLFIILIVGFVIFFAFLKSKRINIILYFSILALIVSSPIIKNLIYAINDKEGDIKESICKKAVDDGMFCKMQDLSYDEYLFITQDSWLPSIPKSSKNISIEYYRDDFLGDYYLIINLWIPKDSNELDNGEGWISAEGTLNGFKRFEYQEGSS